MTSTGRRHAYAFIPQYSWHDSLLAGLREVGDVSRFDYTAHGYTFEEFERRPAASRSRCVEMNRLMFDDLQRTHSNTPVDWVYFYCRGSEVRPELIERIHDQLGLPTVNMCLDDKHGWDLAEIEGENMGQRDLAPVFDLSWTSARVACEWYLVEGGRPVYLPEGFDPTLFRPRPLPKDIAISFVGASYGFRPDVIRALRRADLDVQTFGSGWGGWVSAADQVEIYNRSVINLGMGGIGYSQWLTNVKGRDFEIPGTGGGVYVTTYNSDLSQHFDLNGEIACYASNDELVELCRFYLARPAEAATMSARARARSLGQHRWSHRFERVLETLGIPTVPSSG